MKRLALAALLALPAAGEAQHLTLQNSYFTRGLRLSNQPSATAELRIPLSGAGTSHIHAFYGQNLLHHQPLQFTPGVSLGKDFVFGGDTTNLSVGYQHMNYFKPDLKRIHEPYFNLGMKNANIRGTFPDPGEFLGEARFWYTERNYTQEPIKLTGIWGVGGSYYHENQAIYYAGAEVSTGVTLGNTSIEAGGRFQVGLSEKAQHGATFAVTIRPKPKQ